MSRVQKMSKAQFLKALEHYRDSMVSYYLFLDAIQLYFRTKPASGKFVTVMEKLQLLRYLLEESKCMNFEDADYQPFDDVTAMAKMRDSLYEQKKVK